MRGAYGSGRAARCCRSVALLLVVSACSREPAPAPGARNGGGSEQVSRERVEQTLGEALQRMRQTADSVDMLLRPVPLLTPAQEAALRRYGNVQQLQRARALGVRPANAAALQAALQEGRLITLEDSTELWVVRRLEHSEPHVTPGTRALLVRIGERFRARTESMGLPPYRLEVTSVLRTAASQADLRRTNPNAAEGESTHEYGTTLDIAYESFAAPAATELSLDADMQWLEAQLRPVAAAVLEAAAARKSRELQAILGQVLLELQAQGVVMVTLERQQPVYHLTLAGSVP